MDKTWQIVLFAAAGVAAAGIAISLTRFAFGLISGPDPPRLLDRLVGLVIVCVAIVLPALAIALTVNSVDSFQAHRTDSVFAYLLFWLGPHGWYVLRHRPR